MVKVYVWEVYILKGPRYLRHFVGYVISGIENTNWLHATASNNVGCNIIKEVIIKENDNG